MLQAANTDLFNPLVSRAHSTVKIYFFPFEIKPVKVSYSQLADFYFLASSALMGLNKNMTKRKVNVLHDSSSGNYSSNY